MNIEEFVTKADTFNRDEIEKYNPDMKFLYEIVLDARMRMRFHYRWLKRN